MTTPFPFQSGATLLASQLNAITTLPINDQTASYTLVVGDVGKRVIMNVGSANTCTVNDSIFAAGDTIHIVNKGAGATTVTAGSGVTINSASGLVLPQYQSGQLVALSASSFLFFESDVTATSGVTLIRTTTIGSGVSSHAVTSCFSSTYDNYQITVNGGVGSSSNTHILFQLGATTTGYYWASIAANSGGTSGDSGSNAASWQAGDVNTDYLNLSMNIFSPNLAKYTVFDSGGFNLANGNVRFRSGYQASTTQFTGFTLIPATGTLTGGTVRVYGLQNS